MQKRLAFLVLAGALASCGQPATETPTPDAPSSGGSYETTAPAVSPPDVVPTTTWVYRAPAAGERGRLSYGTPADNYNQILVLECQGHDVSATIYDTGSAEAPQRVAFTLRADDQSANLTGEPEGGGSGNVTATLPLNAPVLARFMTTGGLVISRHGQDDQQVNSRNETEREQIRAFFDACG